MAALVYLRRLGLRLAAVGINRSVSKVMADMRNLHSVLMLPAGARKPRRHLVAPSKTQAEVLLALGRR